MKLNDFSTDECKVRSRFSETGLDYKIKIVTADGDAPTSTNQSGPAQNPTPKQGASMHLLMQQVRALQMEVERLKEQTASSEQSKESLTGLTSEDKPQAENSKQDSQNPEP